MFSNKNVIQPHSNPEEKLDSVKKIRDFIVSQLQRYYDIRNLGFFPNGRLALQNKLVKSYIAKFNSATSFTELVNNLKELDQFNYELECKELTTQHLQWRIGQTIYDLMKSKDHPLAIPRAKHAMNAFLMKYKNHKLSDTLYKIFGEVNKDGILGKQFKAEQDLLSKTTFLMGLHKRLGASSYVQVLTKSPIFEVKCLQQIFAYAEMSPFLKDGVEQQLENENKVAP